MSLNDVRKTLTDRLDEGDRGDRGWFVITRVHVALFWLKGITEYLRNRGGKGPISLTGQDYVRLATIIGSDNDDPGVQLRRHHLLVMDKPLQLLQRVDGRKWNQIKLTNLGVRLADTDDPAEVMEQSLSAMRFAVEPWTPPNRVQQYNEFNIMVYETMELVLKRCDGYIHRDEFDFFVSRIRRDNEINWAVDGIRAYRNLSKNDQDTLHKEVRDRIPGAKAYSNWRDIGLHTFSLFSLGTSIVREGKSLFLTADWVTNHTITESPQDIATTQLRMPDLPQVEGLVVPPSAPASNDGADAESFVAKILRAQGWEVAFYTNRRGFGFDLWACKERRAMLIEVKSSLKELREVSLTPTEYRAAKVHMENFVLALVEHIDSASPRLRMIQNPIENLEIEKRTSTNYIISRAEWLRAAEENE